MDHLRCEYQGSTFAVMEDFVEVSGAASQSHLIRARMVFFWGGGSGIMTEATHVPSSGRSRRSDNISLHLATCTAAHEMWTTIDLSSCRSTVIVQMRRQPNR